jgi:hypothetical protein
VITGPSMAWLAEIAISVSQFAGLRAGERQNPKARRTTKIAEALGIGGASVYRVLEGANRTSRSGARTGPQCRHRGIL